MLLLSSSTLHLHVLLWMCNTPSSKELKCLLETSEFWQRVESYLKSNVCAHFHFPGINRDTIKDIPKESDLAWSWPPNPEDATFDSMCQEMECHLMWLNQIHSCHVGACLSYYGCTALLKCKWQAPWPLSDKDVVDQKGNWQIWQTYGYVNDYNPDLLVALWCNQDIKLLTNGEDTKHLTWYISNSENVPEASCSDAYVLLIMKQNSQDPKSSLTWWVGVTDISPTNSCLCIGVVWRAIWFAGFQISIRISECMQNI